MGVLKDALQARVESTQRTVDLLCSDVQLDVSKLNPEQLRDIFVSKQLITDVLDSRSIVLPPEERQRVRVGIHRVVNAVGARINYETVLARGEEDRQDIRNKLAALPYVDISKI